MSEPQPEDNPIAVTRGHTDPSNDVNLSENRTNTDDERRPCSRLGNVAALCFGPFALSFLLLSLGAIPMPGRTPLYG